MSSSLHHMRIYPYIYIYICIHIYTYAFICLQYIWIYTYVVYTVQESILSNCNTSKVYRRPPPLPRPDHNSTTLQNFKIIIELYHVCIYIYIYPTGDLWPSWDLKVWRLYNLRTTCASLLKETLGSSVSTAQPTRREHRTCQRLRKVESMQHVWTLGSVQGATNMGRSSGKFLQALSKIEAHINHAHADWSSHSSAHFCCTILMKQPCLRGSYFRLIDHSLTKPKRKWRVLENCFHRCSLHSHRARSEPFRKGSTRQAKLPVHLF